MRSVWLCLLLLGLASELPAADISVSSGWSQTVNKNDLVAGAGTDLRSPIESAAGVATLDISNTGGGTWAVSVAKNDVAWPAGVSIAVKRNSDGTGTGTISGGGSYITLSGASQTFFTGSGDRAGVQIQLKVDDLSVVTPPGGPQTYIVNLTYAVQSPVP